MRDSGAPTRDSLGRNQAGSTGFKHQSSLTAVGPPMHQGPRLQSHDTDQGSLDPVRGSAAWNVPRSVGQPRRQGAKRSGSHSLTPWRFAVGPSVIIPSERPEKDHSYIQRSCGVPCMIQPSISTLWATAATVLATDNASPSPTRRFPASPSPSPPLEMTHSVRTTPQAWKDSSPSLSSSWPLPDPNLRARHRHRRLEPLEDDHGAHGHSHHAPMSWQPVTLSLALVLGCLGGCLWYKRYRLGGQPMQRSATPSQTPTGQDHCATGNARNDLGKDVEGAAGSQDDREYHAVDGRIDSGEPMNAAGLGWVSSALPPLPPSQQRHSWNEGILEQQAESLLQWKRPAPRRMHHSQHHLVHGVVRSSRDTLSSAGSSLSSTSSSPELCEMAYISGISRLSNYSNNSLLESNSGDDSSSTSPDLSSGGDLVSGDGMATCPSPVDPVSGDVPLESASHCCDAKMEGVASVDDTVNSIIRSHNRKDEALMILGQLAVASSETSDSSVEESFEESKLLRTHDRDVLCGMRSSLLKAVMSAPISSLDPDKSHENASDAESDLNGLISDEDSDLMASELGSGIHDDESVDLAWSDSNLSHLDDDDDDDDMEDGSEEEEYTETIRTPRLVGESISLRDGDGTISQDIGLVNTSFGFFAISSDSWENHCNERIEIDLSNLRVDGTDGLYPDDEILPIMGPPDRPPLNRETHVRTRTIEGHDCVPAKKELLRHGYPTNETLIEADPTNVPSGVIPCSHTLDDLTKASNTTLAS